MGSHGFCFVLLFCQGHDPPSYASRVTGITGSCLSCLLRWGLPFCQASLESQSSVSPSFK
jgi:hypothetical protein